MGLAYKFKADEVKTVLKSVTYQVGRTGAITPVANLEPILLGGTIVKRASIHNEDQIKKYDLRIGDTVVVEKGGEIIPKITGVDQLLRPNDSKELQYIEHCPSCGSLLKKRRRCLLLNTKGCKPQVLGKVFIFLLENQCKLRFGRTVEMLFDNNIINNVEFIRIEGFSFVAT